jgi:hypothetical protein
MKKITILLINYYVCINNLKILYILILFKLVKKKTYEQEKLI